MHIYDGSADLTDTEGKYIFWDIDGTLAPYRFNDHVGSPDGEDAGMSREEIEDGCFLHRMPSLHMKYVINTCRAEKNIVLGHIICEKERADKIKWLDRHFPKMQGRLFAEYPCPKYKIITNYCRTMGIPLNKVLFVDDMIPFLRDAEKAGIRSFHISSFLDWKYNYDY